MRVQKLNEKLFPSEWLYGYLNWLHNKWSNIWYSYDGKLDKTKDKKDLKKLIKYFLPTACIPLANFGHCLVSLTHYMWTTTLY